MILQILTKSVQLYTAPAKFVYSKALDQIDKARNFADDLQQFKNDLALAEEEVNYALNKIMIQVEQDLEQNYGSITDQRAREAAIVQSLNRAESLLSEASVELLKSLFLLLNPSSSTLHARKKPRLSGNTIEGELIGN